ncbi:hypothetical protein M8C21_018537, partial [Ambrosia artemisiifolia]
SVAARVAKEKKLVSNLIRKLVILFDLKSDKFSSQTSRPSASIAYFGAAKLVNGRQGQLEMGKKNAVLPANEVDFNTV